MLKIRNLDAGYEGLSVLRRVSIHVKAGEIVTIIGANGAGKTTLLKTVAGLLRAQSGEIVFGNQEIRQVATDKIGAYVQFKRGEKQDVVRYLEHVYGLFPVLKQREHQLAGTLSGGEQQMLAMGRALMSRPKLIMLDEPSMGLAPLMVKEIFNIITRIRDEGNTVLLVEQNARSALKIANRGYVLETGRIILEGEAGDLLANRDVQRAYLGREINE
jgi:branched-chain amino acid transport system ATP-binding protein